MARNIETATAYFDRQDPSNEGWAYRIRFDNGDEESGPMDATTDDNAEALTELEAIVGRWGGDWDAGDWRYRDSEDGHYVWTAADPS